MPKAAHASCETSVCSRQGFGEHASSRYRVLGGFACVIRKVSRQGAKNAKRTGTLLHSFWLNDTGPGNGPLFRRRSTPGAERPREVGHPECPPAGPPQLDVAWSPDRAAPGLSADFSFALLAALREYQSPPPLVGGNSPPFLTSPRPSGRIRGFSCPAVTGDALRGINHGEAAMGSFCGCAVRLGAGGGAGRAMGCVRFPAGLRH